MILVCTQNLENFSFLSIICQEDLEHIHLSIEAANTFRMKGSYDAILLKLTYIMIKAENIII